MKVLKFGSTSVGSIQGILNIKKIVETGEDHVVVVVPALNGIKDQLSYASKMALKNDQRYKKELSLITDRHLEFINQIIPYSNLREELQKKIICLSDELDNIFKGVYLVSDLSLKTFDAIVSYGGRMSSLVVSYVIKNAQLFDSRQFVKTEKRFGKHVVDFELTTQLIQKMFTPLPKVSVVAGFISSNKGTEEVTNLGQGGSDYTAAILASVLGASLLEIWTDVDGFMTADPKVISSAYVIENLTFTEAIELCNYGVKVIYPSTIYPVYNKNIPVRILNTFNPISSGTYISNKKSTNSGKSLIKGISSINDTCLITVQGLGMMGVVGINYRIFKTLSQNRVRVFMISQASSENNTSFAVFNEEASLVLRALKEEFVSELIQGEISSISIEEGLATVAVVGENMVRMPGIAGKLFSTLGSAGISVVAFAQGASETNISFVIKSTFLRKALNSIHESLFLSEHKILNLFLAGVGKVGRRLLEQICVQQITLMEQNNLKLRLIGIANSKKYLLRWEGLNLDTCISDLEKNGEDSSPHRLCQKFLELNVFNSVFVDCTASTEIASLYEKLLSNNISVVAANKLAISSTYENYLNLKEIARLKNVKILFETNVGAGLPIISTINNLIHSGDHILRIEAVLSGTVNFIFNVLSSNVSFSEAIRMAEKAHYSEPDPRVDLSGSDVIRKLVILTREAGYKVEQEDVKVNFFIPKKYFEGSLENFWEKIKNLDAEFEMKRKCVKAKNKRIRLVAKMEKGCCEVGLQEVDSLHPFYELEESNNIIMISTKRYKDCPMIIKGYGAGDDVTAAGVFADIISIANI